MKKVIVLIIFILIFTMLPYKFFPTNTVHSTYDYQVIPDDAIRLRILANSDEDKDQRLKQTIRDEVNAEITSWVEEMSTINDARHLIQSRLREIEKIVHSVVRTENQQLSVTVEYGKNVSFPMKLYGSYIYPPGEYEAVLITLGEGKGSNWWCVLFPPLCFLDFSNGTTVAEDENTDDEASAKDQERDEDEGIERNSEEKEPLEHSTETDDTEEDIDVQFFLFEWLGWT
ncbi:stage II sporulation protein R [Virgibacillus sp. W0430]|uniref:stage II sporulation protein R n=1 Tax=Virgibacillus sp. W0430 TaxID=3391580 RepID=UPI003F45FD04